MAAIGKFYLKKENLEMLIKKIDSFGGKGINIDVAFNDELSTYGDNVSVSISQTKEEREQKVRRVYIGNGQVTWAKGECKTAKELGADEIKDRAKRQEIAERVPVGNEDTGDLPF